MVCASPVWARGQQYPCNDCEPCRINRRRVWVNRMMLESLSHSSSCFVTLTYSPRALPRSGSLVPKHMQIFLKLLRSRLKTSVRFYGVGEYGDSSWRPHYHLILFGVSPLQEPVISACWPHGFVKVGDATQESMQYVAGYVVKKLTKRGAPGLDGRLPEFSRMSLKPGIGHSAVKPLVDEVVSSEHALKEVAVNKELPGVVQHGRKKLPVGRYLKDKMKEAYLEQTGEILPKSPKEGPRRVLRMSPGEKADEVARLAARPSSTPEQDAKKRKAVSRWERNSRSRRSL